jgi:hypothetical protein
MVYLMNHESLAQLFHICSHMGMPSVNGDDLAERILAAPGWARLGIAEPTPKLRAAAASELARAILALTTPAPPGHRVLPSNTPMFGLAPRRPIS